MAFFKVRAGLILACVLYCGSQLAYASNVASASHTAKASQPSNKAATKSATKPSPKPSANSSTLSHQRDEWCKKLIPRLPGVSQDECKNASLIATNVQSRNGFPILHKEQSGPKGKPAVRILLLGGIHGDELTASAIVFEWMKWLQTPAAQSFHWKVAPLLNPDGLLAAKPKRTNANGVDLNRNFPTPNWQFEAKRYWAKETGSDPRRFPGNKPLSESESRWVNEQVDRFKPNVIISVHAPFGVLDFDGPAPAPQNFGRLMFNPVGVYPGSLGNYIGMHKNLPVITIELPNSQSMPNEAEVQRIWLDMLKWIQGHVKPSNLATKNVNKAVVKPAPKVIAKPTAKPVPKPTAKPATKPSAQATSHASAKAKSASHTK